MLFHLHPLTFASTRLHPIINTYVHNIWFVRRKMQHNVGIVTNVNIKHHLPIDGIHP
jgi:hypothetical protein